MLLYGEWALNFPDGKDEEQEDGAIRLRPFLRFGNSDLIEFR
jgi:hypothetical protein